MMLWMGSHATGQAVIKGNNSWLQQLGLNCALQDICAVTLYWTRMEWVVQPSQERWFLIWPQKTKVFLSSSPPSLKSKKCTYIIYALWISYLLLAVELTLSPALIIVRYGYHISKNSYFICHDQDIIHKLFERLRNFGGKKGSYPTECGRFSVSAVRDLTTGYDSNQPDKKAVRTQTRIFFREDSWQKTL